MLDLVCSGRSLIVDIVDDFSFATATSFSAWSLCCQQKYVAPSSAPRVRCTATTPEDRARRHGRPLVVMPLHVVAGFFESERDTRDSGVWRAMVG